MSSVYFCVCWRGVGCRGEKVEGGGRTGDWYCAREWRARWKRRGGVGGSKGLVPQQVKSIFLTSSSTAAPLSLGTECWLSRVCLHPPQTSTKTATLLQKFIQGLGVHRKLYLDCTLKQFGVLNENADETTEIKSFFNIRWQRKLKWKWYC